jgi:hypothetical protein
MTRALLAKELREVAWIAALVLLLSLSYVSHLTGMKLFTWLLSEQPTAVPFYGGLFARDFGVLAAVGAVLLGFRQSYWEILRNTNLFLLHRPISRRRVMLTKLAAGAGVLLICTAAPILLYGWWAATPGTHAGPFEWSMTSLVWRVWLAMLLPYLGAFATGVRPANWQGTKLLPLVAAGVLTIAVIVCPFWWLLAVPLLCVFCAGYILLILDELRDCDF